MIRIYLPAFAIGIATIFAFGYYLASIHPYIPCYWAACHWGNQ